MIGKLSTFTTLQRQPVDSQVEKIASTYYLMNTDCILWMTDESDLPTVTTRLMYKFNVYDDQIMPFVIDVGQTTTAITTIADKTPNSTKVQLNVYDSLQSFEDISSTATTTQWTFNVDDIVWGEDNAAGTACRIWVLMGGHVPTPFIVDQTIDAIIDEVETGTTTTTTSSTSSTSSTSTSTSSTSTSSTSTSSTSSTTTNTSSSSTTSTTSTIA